MAVVNTVGPELLKNALINVDRSNWHPRSENSPRIKHFIAAPGRKKLKAEIRRE